MYFFDFSTDSINTIKLYKHICLIPLKPARILSCSTAETHETERELKK